MTRGRRAPACRDVTLKVDERRLSRSEAIRVLPRDGEAREILARENLMGKRRNQHPQQFNTIKTASLPAIPSSTTCWHGGIRLRASNLPRSQTSSAM
jgi:hypothetical protein